MLSLGNKLFQGQLVQLCADILVDCTEYPVKGALLLLSHAAAVEFRAETMVDFDGAVDFLDDFTQGNLSGGTRELISAADAFKIGRAHV